MSATTFSARVEIDRAVKALQALGGDANRAMARGLNRSAKSEQVAIARDVRASIGLTASRIKSEINITAANVSRLIARLKSRGYRIPLIEFGGKGPEPSRGQGSGASARLEGKRKRYPHAFVATMDSGHRGIFERTPGKVMRLQKPTWKIKRQAIHELMGPSIAKAFERAIPIGQQRREEVLYKNIKHEIEFQLSRARRA